MAMPQTTDSAIVDDPLECQGVHLGDVAAKAVSPGSAHVVDVAVLRRVESSEGGVEVLTLWVGGWQWQRRRRQRRQRHVVNPAPSSDTEATGLNRVLARQLVQMTFGTPRMLWQSWALKWLANMHT